MFDKILFPVDRSREAQQAVEVVSDLVRTHQSKLVLLSVVETEADGNMNSETEVAKLLEGAKALFQQQGINAETIEREGMPSFAICDVADEINADLIIMGSHGLGLNTDAVQKSVVHRTIDLAPCPVLIVP